MHDEIDLISSTRVDKSYGDSKSPACSAPQSYSREQELWASSTDVGDVSKPWNPMINMIESNLFLSWQHQSSNNL